MKKIIESFVTFDRAFILSLGVFACLAVFSVAANGQACTLTSGAASYVIPATGHYDGTPTVNFTGVGTGDYLFEDGWFFRISGDAQEFPFPAPSTTTCAADAGTITWTNVSTRGFSATNTLNLTSAAAGSGVLTLTMSVTNLSGTTPLNLSLFHAADFDVNGTAGTDNGTLLTPNTHMRFTDTTAGSAEYKARTPASNAFMVRPFAATTDVFGLLGDVALTNLDNTGLPAVSIDVTSGYQWNLTIPANGTASVTVVLTGNTPAPMVAGDVLISEFRVRGPSGANDEFIELYNATGAQLTAQAADASSGLGVAASDGTTRCFIPNGTIIPAGGHYLCTNSVAFSLAGYATGNATYTTDIPDNAGIAIFNNSTGGGSYTLANRLDAVGSTSEANAVYKEGAGYPALTPFSIDYSFYRDNCGKGGSISSNAPCTTSVPIDTGNNALDFIFVDTNGTSAGAGQRLGAPGPENLTSPVQVNSTVAVAPLDANLNTQSPPNQVRVFTSDPANNSTFGTLDIRRRITNNTGAPITRLRFRVIDQTTFPAPAGWSDLRSRTSTAVVVAGVTDAATCAATGAPATPPCTVTVEGTTLEQPPNSPNGSAFNGSLSAGTVTLGTPLAAGASINLRFLFGIQQTGIVHLGLNVEALPGGVPSAAAPPVNLFAHTEGVTAAGVTVGGRVLTEEGRGLRGSRVTMTDSNGMTRSVFTSAMGRFQFEDVESGHTYIVTVGSRRFTYSPQSVVVTDNIADLNFFPGK